MQAGRQAGRPRYCSYSGVVLCGGVHDYRPACHAG